MADRWTEDRERWARERNWRNEAYGRGSEADRLRSSNAERRSFHDDDARFESRGGDRVFGERETGEDYNERQSAGRRGYGGDFSGEGPQSGLHFDRQDYTRGRDPYAAAPRRIGREDYGPDGLYDSGYRAYGDRDRQGGRGYGGESRYGGGPADRDRPAWQARDYQGVSPAMRKGEYDLDRDADRYAPRDRDEDRGRGSEDFLRRAGERISSWFRGDERRDDYDRRYDTDHDCDRRWDSGAHRGRGPKGYQRPDERISDEVHQRLTDDPWVDASNISASVSGGEVTLSGTVENRESKHRAERCVEDITGVRHVQNNLRVEHGGMLTSPGRGYGDSVLEAEMRKNEGSTVNDEGTTSKIAKP